MATSIIRADGERLTFDAVPSLDIGRQVIVSQHPRERGADATDHAQALGQVITIRGYIGEHRGRAAQSAILRALDQIATTGEVVTVEGDRFGSRQRFVVAGFGQQFDPRAWVAVTIDLQQIEIVEPRTVEIPPGQPVPVASDLATEQDEGRQAGEELDPARDQRARSTLATIADWLGG